MDTKLQQITNWNSNKKGGAMEVTKVSVTKVSLDKRTRFRGFATVELDGSVVITNIRIIDGEDGKFLAMPSVERKRACKSCGAKFSRSDRFCPRCGTEAVIDLANLKHKSVVKIINPQLLEKITEAVIKEYERVSKL